MRLAEDEARARLAAHDHGILCTVHAERGVDAVPVVYVVDDDGYVGVPVDRVKPKASLRLQRERNLEADPRATLLVEHWDRDDWSRLWWVRAELRLQATLPRAGRALAAGLAERYPQYRDQPFARVLVLRIVGVTGWAAAAADLDEEEKRMAQDVLAGRYALVTGGARGLGAGMAQALAAAGAAVMIGDVLDDLAGETASGLGGRATHLDVTDEASWEAAVAATVEQLGGLDILVNNAGIEISGLIADVEAADLRRMLEVNVLGTALGIKHGLRAMRPGGAAGHGGAIVNISSVAATIAFPGIAGYSATKSAVDRLTRVAAFEAGKLGFGVRVNCVYPGLVPTEMGQKLAVDMAELGLFESPDAAVGAVIEQTPAGPVGRGLGHGRRGRVPRLRPGALHHRSRAARRRWDGNVSCRCDGLAHRLPRQGCVARPRRALPGRGRPLAVLRRRAGPQPPRRGRARARRHRAGRQGRHPQLEQRRRVRVRVRHRPPRRGVVPDQPAQRGGREPRAARRSSTASA